MRNLGLYAFLSLTFCIGCSEGTRVDHDNRTAFRYNQSQNITSLDPAFSRNLENLWACDHLYNGLVQMDDELTIEPCIAKSWEISGDGKTYTFHLRQDVYFHDSEVFQRGKGRAVTASDFVSSFFRILDSEVASPGAWIFNKIDRSEENNYLGFSALDDSTFRIHLTAPFPPFLGLLTMKYCSVVPNEAIERYGDDFRNHPVGTGPFKFKVWKEDGKLILLKNPNYFEKDEDGNALPYLDAIAISFIKDEEAAFNEFLLGNLDFINGLNGNFKDHILESNGTLKEEYKDRFTMNTYPYLNTEYLGFLMDNESEIMKSSPLRFKKVRQAINYGFNREDMITYLRYNIGYPAHAGFIPKGLPAYNEKKVIGYHYDPDKSRKLLAEAGFPNGTGLPEITLSTTGQYLDLCEYIQNQLSEIGINIKIEVNQAATHREMVARLKLPFFRKSWLADYPDAENYLALFYSKNFSPKGPNYTHFSNYQFDRLYEKSQSIIDEKSRYELYQQMDQIIVDEAPIVPLYYDEIVHFSQKNIVNMSSNPMNLLSLKRVKKQ